MKKGRPYIRKHTKAPPWRQLQTTNRIDFGCEHAHSIYTFRESSIRVHLVWKSSMVSCVCVRNNNPVLTNFCLEEEAEGWIHMAILPFWLLHQHSRLSTWSFTYNIHLISGCKHGYYLRYIRKNKRYVCIRSKLIWIIYIFFLTENITRTKYMVVLFVESFDDINVHRTVIKMTSCYSLARDFNH
jgi:hypothetical protein